MITLSKHVSDEMGRRGITLAFIERTLASADWVCPDLLQPSLNRSYKVIGEFGDRILRVVHRPEGSGTFVVTAHWDRGAKPR